MSPRSDSTSKEVLLHSEAPFQLNTPLKYKQTPNKKSTSLFEKLDLHESSFYESMHEDDSRESLDTKQQHLKQSEKVQL